MAIIDRAGACGALARGGTVRAAAYGAVAVSLLTLMVGSAAFGQENKDQQKCINGLNKDTCKVAAAQGKENSGCVKLGTKGTATSGCLTADAKSKVAKKKTKTLSDEGGNLCLGANAPNFGYTSGGSGNTTAMTQEVNLFSDTYGTTDPTAVISTAKLEGGCQAAVTKDLEKIIATKWKQYVSCKKNALKNGASNPGQLEACLSGDPNSIAVDPKGKINKSVLKLLADQNKKCAGVNSATTFPGSCSTEPVGPALAVCLDIRAECRICLALNAIDNLSVNCDLFDDGVANSSCGAACPNSCPIAKGRYTQTTTGGTLHVSSFAPFAFPGGGVIIQDVDCGDVNCVHPTVVPLGGFTMQSYCVPALGATTKLTQSGCGVGRIDSDGGSDFTVTEHGDTSEETVCGLSTHQASCGVGQDSSGRIDVQVGGNGPDTCASGGTANAIVAIPVNSLTWVAVDASCPDTDGTFNPGTDTQLAAYPQTLDFTTDTNTAMFVDFAGSAPDPDGCKLSGLGPTGPYAGTGMCISGGTTVSVAASGTLFSSGPPVDDFLYTTVQNATIAAPAAFGGATCGSPPPINFAGTATRCIIAP